MTDKELLDYLEQSEAIRLVVEGKYKPWELDRAFKNMKKRMREMEHTRILDRAQIVAYRRQIEMLVEGGA